MGEFPPLSFFPLFLLLQSCYYVREVLFFFLIDESLGLMGTSGVASSLRIEDSRWMVFWGDRLNGVDDYLLERAGWDYCLEASA